MNNDIRKARAAIIATLNDEFRATGQGGRVVITSGVWQQGTVFVTEVIARVQNFQDFTARNDPYGEHNAGSFAVAGKTVKWQIDCYDAAEDWVSNDPSNPDITSRVLTIFFPIEN